MNNPKTGPRGGQYIEKECPQCKKNFFNPSYYEKRGRRAMCSRKCQDDSHYEMITCLNCGTVNKEKKREKRMFCNRACHGAYRANSVRISGWAKQTWANKIKARDGECRICGGTDSLEAHHVASAHLRPDLVLEEINGIALCKSCHIKTETYGNHVYKLANKKTTSFIGTIEDVGANFIEMKTKPISVDSLILIPPMTAIEVTVKVYEG